MSITPLCANAERVSSTIASRSAKEGPGVLDVISDMAITHDVANKTLVVPRYMVNILKFKEFNFNEPTSVHLTPHGSAPAAELCFAMSCMCIFTCTCISRHHGWLFSQITMNAGMPNEVPRIFV